MRASVRLLGGVVAALVGAAASTGGCALFYGYGGYHQQGSGGAGGTTSSSGPSGGGVGGGTGGAAGHGGSGPSCPGDADAPFSVAWSNVYGSGQPLTVAGATIDGAGAASGSGDVAIAGTFTGELKVGQTLEAETRKAMLVARFGPTGKVLFADAFGSSTGDVTATTLSVDVEGNPVGFATFTKKLTVNGTSFPDPPSADSWFTLEVDVDKGNGNVVLTNDIECIIPGGGTTCNVTVNSSTTALDGLYLAGSFVGKAFFDATHTTAHALTSTGVVDGFAARFGVEQYQLEAVGGTHQMTAFVPLPTTSVSALVGYVRGLSDLDACNMAGPSPADNDVFIMGLSSGAPAWNCSGIYNAAGDQYVDAAVATNDGNLVIAGRADGGLNIPTFPLSGNPTGVFVARLQGANGQLASASDQLFLPIPLSFANTPVHLAMASDGSLLLSGSFHGSFRDEMNQKIRSSGDNGFVAAIDKNLQLEWVRAVLPCDGGGGPTTAIASWTNAHAIGIAGTIAGTSSIGGTVLESAGGTALYAARLDLKK